MARQRTDNLKNIVNDSDLESRADELRQLIPSLRPINRLPHPIVAKLVEQSTIDIVAGGQQIISSDKPQKHTVYLLEGAVELLSDDERVNIVRAGTRVSLKPLDPKADDWQVCNALRECAVARIPKELLEASLFQYAPVEVTQELEVADINAEESSDSMVKLLQSAIFSCMPATKIQALFGVITKHRAEPGEEIVKQDDAGEHYYVIVEGRCEVTRTLKASNRDVALAELGPGESFGEVALITGQNRDATVTALSPMELIKLEAKDFHKLVLEPLTRRIPLDDAAALIGDGAQWIDIREPTEFKNGAFPDARNVALNLIRLHSRSLPSDQTYIVCGGNARLNTLGAFLLSERGFDVLCLDSTIEACVKQHGIELVGADSGGTVVPIITQTAVSPSSGDSEELPVVSILDPALINASIDPGETITRASLVAVIEELENDNSQISASAGPESISLPQLVTEDAPLSCDCGADHPLPLAGDDVCPASSLLSVADATLGAANADLSREQFRSTLEREMTKYKAALDAEYEQRFTRYKHDVQVEVRKHQDKFLQTYKTNQANLKAHSDKVLALANRVGEQKQSLQQAWAKFRTEFGDNDKLRAEIAELREIVEATKPEPVS